MSSGIFFAARLREWTEQIRRYGTTFDFKGTLYNCISPPREQTLEMKAANYQEEIPGEFTMLKSEYFSAGIRIKDRITADDGIFEIYAVSIDSEEPTVVLRANRKQ